MFKLHNGLCANNTKLQKNISYNDITQTIQYTRKNPGCKMYIIKCIVYSNQITEHTLKFMHCKM